MEAHQIAKALEVWTLQRLPNLTILLGFVTLNPDILADIKVAVPCVGGGVSVGIPGSAPAEPGGSG